VQVWWRSGHLTRGSGDLWIEETICAKSLQTDRQTDDGRRAIALAHLNERIKTVFLSLRIRYYSPCQFSDGAVYVNIRFGCGEWT